MHLPKPSLPTTAELSYYDKILRPPTIQSTLESAFELVRELSRIIRRSELANRRTSYLQRSPIPTGLATPKATSRPLKSRSEAQPSLPPGLNFDHAEAMSATVIAQQHDPSASSLGTLPGSAVELTHEHKHKTDESQLEAVVIGPISAVIVTILLILGVYYCYRRFRQRDEGQGDQINVYGAGAIPRPLGPRYWRRENTQDTDDGGIELQSQQRLLFPPAAADTRRSSTRQSTDSSELQGPGSYKRQPESSRAPTPIACGPARQEGSPREGIKPIAGMQSHYLRPSDDDGSDTASDSEQPATQIPTPQAPSESWVAVPSRPTLSLQRTQSSTPQVLSQQLYITNPSPDFPSVAADTSDNPNDADAPDDTNAHNDADGNDHLYSPSPACSSPSSTGAVFEGSDPSNDSHHAHFINDPASNHPDSIPSLSSSVSTLPDSSGPPTPPNNDWLDHGPHRVRIVGEENRADLFRDPTRLHQDPTPEELAEHAEWPEDTPPLWRAAERRWG